MIRDAVERYDDYEVECPSCKEGILEMDLYDLENYLLDKRMDEASFKELMLVYRFWEKTGGRLSPECEGNYIIKKEECR